MIPHLSKLYLLALFLFTALPALAESTSEPSRTDLEEQSSTTRGEVTIEGQVVEYTATVGDLVLRDDAGEPRARMTYVSYVREGVTDRATRPVLFAFNGGPGSASVWVHLGAYGPKKVALDDEGYPTGPPPGRLVDNEYSLLDVADLVFIDPVETGWSRPAPGHKTTEFTGYTHDVIHVGDLIRLWLSRENRWASPKFIAGESYGSTRAAGLASYLQEAHGAFINGVALVSSVINWQTKVFNIGNDLPHVLILPTYTAIAWYHDKLPERYDGDLQAALRDAEAFALTDYLPALALGERLPTERRAEIVRRTAELTGLSERYVEDTDLRIEIFRFAKELLRDEGKTVGRLDGRYTGADRDDAAERFEFDPAFSLVIGHYVSLLKDYLRRDLGFERDEHFRHSAGQRVRPWNYHEADRTEGYNTNAYANYAETLREAMHRNPALQVLVQSGYYDLATPYFASDYTVDHMQLDPAIRPNLKVAYYDAGHMMYVRRADHEKFRRDTLQWIEDALSWTPPAAD
ncbi:MAG: peptidase S10 [Acidobacteriota bacterium]